MTQVEIVENPVLDGKRRAFVLAEDRVGHYPEFRAFFVRQFSLDANGLSRPGYVRAPYDVEHAVAHALRLGAISFDAVKMLVLAKLETRPARLDLTFYPYLPAATVGTTDPRAYLDLVANARPASMAAGALA